MDDPADHMQAPVEEVVGAGNDGHRQFQRLGPLEHIGQRHGLVFRAVDDDGIRRDRFGLVLAVALDEAGRGADQHQPACRHA
ncbi:MAG: hypothetical protein IPJ52_05990 [Rhodocyclaceae bacterium]|nr:hypothetical protein [Rhodocyclaceae bacterium]